MSAARARPREMEPKENVMSSREIEDTQIQRVGCVANVAAQNANGAEHGKTAIAMGRSKWDHGMAS